MSIKSIHARITGRVQGVWYRGWTEETANELGLNGWVKNMPNGSVEALFSGEADIVDEMIVRCYEGPRFANVTQIIIETDTPPVGKGFVVKR